MTKQEEIKEGIAEYVCGICVVQGEVTDSKCVHKIIPCLYARIKANDIFSYLHSQGAVLQVERELPKNPYYIVQEMARDSMYNEAQQDMLKAGCGFFEPLIKEK